MNDHRENTDGSETSRTREAARAVSPKRFIVGLGNPGERYAATRHNVGFLAVEKFCREFEFALPRREHESLVARARWRGDRSEVVVVRPQSFMNRSGRAVRSLLAAELESDDLADLRSRLLVVHDDIDLPLGKLRYRSRGSAGGHRGIDSIALELRTTLFDRLKVGIGRGANDAADYVLAPLAGAEQDEIDAVAAHASSTIPTWIAEGCAACANRYNGRDGELYPASE